MPEKELIYMVDLILFDLDGTLTDPEEGITNSVVYALQTYGIQESPSRCRRFIGPPLGPELQAVYGVDPVESVLRFREYFEQKGIYENKLYPDTVSVLKALKEAGKTLVVATSKPQVYAERILDHFDLRQYIDGVFGATLDESKVLKSEIIADALAAFDQRPVVMVGDRLHDIHGAAENGIPSVGLLSGFGSRQELESAGADYIRSSLTDALDLLLTVPEPQRAPEDGLNRSRT